MNWDEAINKLNKMEFPTNTGNYKKLKIDESHEHKKIDHTLMTYEYAFNLGSYPCLAKYNTCEYCKSTMNKFLAIFNDVENLCYIRHIRKHGEFVYSNPSSFE